MTGLILASSSMPMDTFASHAEDTRGDVESDERSLVLSAAVQLEQKLGEILQGFLAHVSASEKLVVGPLSSLRARAMACHALALIDQREFADCESITRIADDFRRLSHASLKVGEANSACRKLHFKDKGPLDPVRQLRSGITNLMSRLAHRGFYVESEQRTERNWQI